MLVVGGWLLSIVVLVFGGCSLVFGCWWLVVERWRMAVGVLVVGDWCRVFRGWCIEGAFVIGVCEVVGV